MITALLKQTLLLAALAAISQNTIAINPLAAPPLANAGLENIVVETYYVSNAADAAQADNESTDNGFPTGALPEGSVTYRIYADMLSGYKLLGVYAEQSKGHDLQFSTSTSFYNNPNGGTTPSTNKASIKNKLLALDSWLSLGGVATGQYGVLKSEDNGLLNNITSANNIGGVLLNNATSAGIPLTTQDGMIAGTGIRSVSFLGFKGEESVLGDGTVVGSNLVVHDASIFTTDGAVGPDATTNKLLIAQITTNGSLSFKLNLILKAPDGTTETYVYSNPKDGDILFPALSR